MLSKILTLQGVKKLTKQQAIEINGSSDSCLLNCAYEFNDCTEKNTQSYCLQLYFVCRGSC